jgi:opacity protein-like surface antigen
MYIIMKKFLLTAVLGMFALAGFSQMTWNAKVGMSMTNLSNTDADMKVGYTVGVGLDYQFTDMWYLQSGLNITGKGAKAGDLKIKTHYLEIPVLAAAKFDVSDNMKFVVNAGPYLAFGMGGKLEEGNASMKVFSKEDGMEEALMKRFDLGLQYGVGLELSDKYLINLTGQYGFIDPFKGDSGESSHNIAFMIGVGYRF